MSRPYQFWIEPLESRIAPAIIIANPFFDLTPGVGQKSTSLDLGTLVDPSVNYRTVVEFQTNYTLPGQSLPGVIRIELFDDKAPLTVANFLRYVNNKNALGDYDGVFFHRLEPGFVLQGGGFNATDRSTHIPVFETIHNEFDPNDPERSNIAQTVAMAKVASEQGGGPHSATSEFFINLGDNASNLNAQNGGFTVFGRVTDETMPVVNAIGALQRVGGAPVQNYTAGTPTPDQLIQIVDARILRNTGDPAGHTFTVDSVTDAATGQPTKLVSAKIAKDGKLDLTYNGKQAGVAKVKIKISKAGEMDVFDEFLVTLRPNLISEVTSDGLTTTFVPGDKGTARVEIANNGPGIAKGQINVQLFLSKSASAGGSDGPGFELKETGENADLLIATRNSVNVSIASGKSTTIPINYIIPSTGLEDGQRYRLLAKVMTSTGSTIVELFNDDNVGNFRKDNLSLDSAEVLRTFDLAFGSVGGRSGVPLTITDADGDQFTLQLAGPGNGTVTFDENGRPSIAITGTNASSTLSIRAARDIIANIGDLNVSDTIGTIRLPNVHLHGNMPLSGGVRSVTLGDLSDKEPLSSNIGIDRTISIGAFPNASQKLTLRLGSVSDYTLYSDTPIATLNAREWLDDEIHTAKNQISVFTLGTLRIAGDLEANLIFGDTRVNLISVGGTLRGSEIRTTGDIARLDLRDISASTILARLSAIPDEASDLATASTIGTLQIRGTFSDSTVAAARINTINITSVDGSAGTTSGGIIADAIQSYLRQGSPRQVRLDAPAIFDTVAPNYSARVL